MKNLNNKSQDYIFLLINWVNVYKIDIVKEIKNMSHLGLT